MLYYIYYIILYYIILYYIIDHVFFPMVDPLTGSVPLAAQGLGQPAPPPGDDAHPGIEAPHGQKKPWSLDDKRWENRDFTTDTTGKLRFHWAKYGKIVISLRKLEGLAASGAAQKRPPVSSAPWLVGKSLKIEVNRHLYTYKIIHIYIYIYYRGK